MRQAQSEAVAGGLAFGLCGGRDCKHEFCGLWFEIMARARCSVWAWARTLTRLACKTLLPGPWRVLPELEAPYRILQRARRENGDMEVLSLAPTRCGFERIVVDQVTK